MRRPCTSLPEHPTKAQRLGFHWVSQRKISTNDLRQVPGNGEQVQPTFWGERLLCDDDRKYKRGHDKELYQRTARGRQKEDRAFS